MGFVCPHVLKVESTEETEGRKPISFVVPGINSDGKHTPKKTGPIKLKDVEKGGDGLEW